MLLETLTAGGFVVRDPETRRFSLGARAGRGLEVRRIVSAVMGSLMEVSRRLGYTMSSR